MASRSANIVFDILAKDNASKVFDKMSDKLASQERALNGLRVAGTAQFVALAAAGALYAKNAIGSARDLGETVNMATVVFGDQADEMLAWASTADQSVGLSKQAALEATATFGDMFSQLKFSGDEAASLSTSTVQLAADLGSFRNLPTEDVLLRIQAAMRGEFDSLKLLVPNISAARIETEALAASGKTAASELTAQEKVAATLAVIQKDSANATGDFARTSGDLANQQKILQATNENVSAQLGEDLLPITLAFTSAARDVLAWTSENETATKFLVVTIGTLSAAIAVAANWQGIQTTATTIGVAAEWAWSAAKQASNVVLGRSIPLREADAVATATSTAAIGALTATTAASTAATAASTAANKANASSLSGMAKAAGPVGAALAVMFAAGEIPKWGTESAEGAGVATSALIDLAEGADIADTSLGQMLNRGGFKDWFTGNDVDNIERAYEVLKDTSVTDQVDNVISSVLTLGQSTSTSRLQSEELFNTLDEGLSSLVQSGNADTAAQAIENLGLNYEDVKDLLPGYADALANTENQTRLSTDATEAGTDATEDAADAVLSLVDALAEQIKKQHEAAGVALDENSALRDYESAIDDAAASIEENGKTLDVHTQKGRDNQAALDDIASSTWDWIDAGSAAGESQIVLAERMSQGRQSFIDTATQLGLTKAEASGLADEMGLVPTEVVTDITLSGYADTYRYLTNIQSAIRGITGNSSIRVAMGAGGSGGQTFAGGGPITGRGTSTSDDILIRASNGEYMQNAAAHGFWGTAVMDALNNRDVAGVFAAMPLAGFAGGGSPTSSVYRGLPATSRGVSPSGGAAVFHLYDTDGALLGTMRGAADNSARFTQQARSASMRGGGGR